MYLQTYISLYPLRQPVDSAKSAGRKYPTRRDKALQKRFILGLISTTIRPLGFTHRTHVWYIYLHEWLIFMVNVGECSMK